MKVISRTGKENIAFVYIGEFDQQKKIEFVESVQPPIPLQQKWVLIVSTLFGCPVQCLMCDASSHYAGKLSADEIIAQIDHMVVSKFPDRNIPVKKFKIQFARMGEPSFNKNVLEVLQKLPSIYDAPGLMPAISTIAPMGTHQFFRELLDIKNKLYKNSFQLQFSIHTTDQKLRDWLVPAKKWDFTQISDYSSSFFTEGQRKITLNFALAKNIPVDVDELLKYFDPKIFLIKITPINPTLNAANNKLESYITPEKNDYKIICRLKQAGYETLLSIGEWEENKIGSNCGQYISATQSMRLSV